MMNIVYPHHLRPPCFVPGDIATWMEIPIPTRADNGMGNIGFTNFNRFVAFVTNHVVSF